MKYLLSFSISVILSLSCLAQSYLVYTVKGDVVSKGKAKAAQILPGDRLTDKTVLSVSADGRLTVIDEKSESLYTVKEGIGTLSSLIAAQQSKSRPVTPSFLAFVKEKISTKSNPKDVNYMQAAGVTYRGLGQDFIPLQGASGMLLDPLREAFSTARQALADGDADILLSVSDRLDSLGLVRYDFTVVSDYTPQSFNGYFVFDPLCLVDLASNVGDSRPVSEQIADLPVPMAPSTDNKLSGGDMFEEDCKRDKIDLKAKYVYMFVSSKGVRWTLAPYSLFAGCYGILSVTIEWKDLEPFAAEPHSERR